MSARTDLAALRRKLAAAGAGFSPGAPAFSLGAPAMDAALGQGIPRGVLHEIYPRAAGDVAAATGFALALALRAGGERPVFWIRQDVVDVEAGALYAPGLCEFGLDPARLVLVRVRDCTSVLRATEEATRCAALGAVVSEPWGAPKALDLTASRRLALAAERSGVTLLMTRGGAAPAPSAAATRWDIGAALSAPLAADAPGAPAFTVTLARMRNGAPGGPWHVEWDRDRQAFNDATLSRDMAAVSDGGPAAEAWLDAG